MRAGRVCYVAPGGPENGLALLFAHPGFGESLSRMVITPHLAGSRQDRNTNEISVELAAIQATPVGAAGT